MIEFDKTEHFSQIIEREQAKHHNPMGCKLDIEKVSEYSDSLTSAISKIADEIAKDNDMYLICEMAKEWVKAQANRKILYETMIPLNPRTKKNHQKIIYNRKTHKSIIVQGDIYKQYEKDCAWFLKRPAKPIDTPVNIKCVFYREKAIRCDLTNLLEAIDDILIKYKIIADDNFNIIAGHDGSRDS